MNDNKNQDIIIRLNASLKTHLLITKKPFLWTVLLILKIPNFTQSPMSDLGFPAKGATCPSQQYLEGHSRFLGGPFFNLMYQVNMLPTNVIFSEFWFLLYF